MEIKAKTTEQFDVALEAEKDKLKKKLKFDENGNKGEHLTVSVDEGAAEGSVVGTGEGGSEGFRVGRDVGMTVGSGVGTAEGLVGAEVGEQEYSSAQQRA